MSDSVFGNEKTCLLCATTQNLHKHHVYGGSRRHKSEQEGCWCWLCGAHHNMSRQGIHFNKPFDDFLKGKCQKLWQERNGKSVEDFISVFGRSYM